jgi:hypothetical protein
MLIRLGLFCFVLLMFLKPVTFAQEAAAGGLARGEESGSPVGPSSSTDPLPFWTKPFGLNNPPANSATQFSASAESDFILGAIVACMSLLVVAIFRLPTPTEALTKFRNERDISLLMGIGFIAMGVGELYVGFRSGRMEYIRQFRPNVWISYSDSKVFFSFLGLVYSMMVVMGVAFVKMTFEPSVAVAPFFKHAPVLRFVWLIVICTVIFALIFLR